MRRPAKLTRSSKYAKPKALDDPKTLSAIGSRFHPPLLLRDDLGHDAQRDFFGSFRADIQPCRSMYGPQLLRSLTLSFEGTKNLSRPLLFATTPK